MIMLLHSHRLQLVATSCTTAVVHYENPATATEFLVFSSWVQLGCSFFPVAATGPSKTSSLMHQIDRVSWPTSVLRHRWMHKVRSIILIV
jgi:hypothetical protein